MVCPGRQRRPAEPVSEVDRFAILVLCGRWDFLEEHHFGGMLNAVDLISWFS